MGDVESITERMRRLGEEILAKKTLYGELERMLREVLFGREPVQREAVPVVKSQQASEAKTDNPTRTRQVKLPIEDNAFVMDLDRDSIELKNRRLMGRYREAWLATIPKTTYWEVAEKEWVNVEMIKLLDKKLARGNSKRTNRMANRIAAVVLLWSEPPHKHAKIIANFAWLADGRTTSPLATSAMVFLACMPKGRRGMNHQLAYLRAMDALLGEDHGAASIEIDSIPTDHRHFQTLERFGACMAKPSSSQS